MKSYTDISQSKKLAEILPLESADMNYWCGTQIRIGGHRTMDKDLDVPCWSLASLLEQFPYELCDNDGNSSYLQINKEDDVYQLAYKDPYGDFESIETDRHEHFVDACFEMIIRLNELKML